MAKAATPVDELTFDVEDPSTDSYKTFISELRGKLAGRENMNIRGHPVMDGPQTGDNNPPPRWIYVVLSSGKGPVKPRVAVRSDNAYIAGFTNSKGDWFQFKSDDDDKGKTTEKILPDATVLGFTADYRSLIGNPPIRSLPKLKLGMVNTVGAASVLWSYVKKKKKIADETDDEDNNDDAIITGSAGAADDPDKNLKTALARLAVSFCEAARLIPVHRVVADGWGSEQGVSVKEQEVWYILKWSKLSTALLGWKADGYKNDKCWFRHLKDSTRIDTGEKALDVVQLVLNKPPEKGREDGEDDPTTAGEEQ